MDSRFASWVAASIKRWGPAYGVAIDPGLVLGIIQRESLGGKVLEVPESNGTTSWGPMGVNDTVALDFGVSPASIMRDKPQLGIWYGVKQLAILLQRFPGDTARAVSAYNAGSGNAVRAAGTGRFPNQTYVDAVLSYAKGGAGLMLLALAIGAGALMSLRRRRAA
jgi:soluble lytic murein transglycosylase-like protein